MNFLIVGKTPKAYFLASKLSLEDHLVYLCIEQFDKNYKFIYLNTPSNIFLTKTEPKTLETAIPDFRVH